MELSDLGRRTLVGYLRHLIDGGSHLVTEGELAPLAAAEPGEAGRIGEAAAEAGRWCSLHSLPNIASAVISPEHDGTPVMLPRAAVVAEIGGEAATHAEQARVRDFDWEGWRDG